MMEGVVSIGYTAFGKWISKEVPALWSVEHLPAVHKELHGYTMLDLLISSC